MTNEIDVLHNLRKMPSVYMALEFLKRHTVQPSNKILNKDFKKYKISDLALEMDVSRQIASKYIGVLLSKNIVSWKLFNDGKFLVLNTDVCSQSEINLETTDKKTFPKTMFTSAEVADILQISCRIVDDWIINGNIKAIKLGKIYRISVEEVEYIQKNGLREHEDK